MVKFLSLIFRIWKEKRKIIKDPIVKIANWWLRNGYTMVTVFPKGHVFCMHYLFFEECIQTCEVLIAEEWDWGTQCVCICQVWMLGAGGGQKPEGDWYFSFFFFNVSVKFEVSYQEYYLFISCWLWIHGWWGSLGRSLPWAI